MRFAPPPKGLRDPPGCSCYEVNTDYAVTGDVDLDAFDGVASPQDCQDLCVRNPDCLFWTYVTLGEPSTPGKCFLKDHILSKANMNRKISGPRICPHLRP